MIDYEEMYKTLIEELTIDLIVAAGRVNDCKISKDFGRNCINYGIATKCVDVLKSLRQRVSITCLEDDGYLEIERLAINGNITSFF